MNDFQDTNDSSQESNDSVADVANAQHTEGATETDTQEAQPHRPGYVDFRTATPEEVEAKFNDLYGQTKQSKRAAQEAKQIVEQFKAVAAEQAQFIAELTSNQHNIVNHLEQKSYAEAEAALFQKAQSAFEAGDTQGFMKANSDLADIRTKKILQEQQQKAQSKPQQQPANRYPDAAQMAKQAFDDGDISEQEVSIISAWRDERDDSGRELRPWAVNKGSGERPDPDYARAFFTAQSVFENPQYSKLSTEQKLAKVDELMGVKKSTPSQSVMGGGLTNRKAASKITLSPQIEKFAVRTKFGGSKAKSDADHIEAYRQQIIKAKGVRK